ncbi:hypothetical protein [Marinobacterium litorale]|uniref:hypothetical protein n=1 Tax=Marinobacterium litorale TaxID=404770 RepID=UPI00040D1D0A|nr:hypothetical protein [Marinobacterium litorale]
MDRLTLLHQTLLEGLAQIAGVRHCSSFPKRRDEVRLPAIFLDLAELEPARDPGTGELALIAHWEARVLVSDRQPEAVLWSLVQAVMLWLYDHAWAELNVGRANIKQAAPDHFSPEYQGHRIWLVEWTHTLRVGESIWAGEGIVPDTVILGWNGEAGDQLELTGDDPSV